MPVSTPPPEAFLQYVWHTINFDINGLETVCGKPVSILYQGRWNHDQGPDFLNATLQIGEMQWHGHVEIHLRSRDWFRHRHQSDVHYNATVLHVVMKSDRETIIREDGTRIPELELISRIPRKLKTRFDQLQLSQDTIPCNPLIDQVKRIHIYPWIERLAIDRVQDKAEGMRIRLAGKRQDWEQILWEEISAMIGGPVNQDAFRLNARQIPFAILKKYRNKARHMEALLFGGAGLLASEHVGDEYYEFLRNEWHFLRDKHQLHGLVPANLRFMRMRPASFPTVRLSQLASVVQTYPKLIDLLDSQHFKGFIKNRIQASPYWESHYRFFETTKARKKSLGKSQKEVLIINTLVPMAYLYGEAHGRDDLDALVEDALVLMPAEKNKITALFSDLKIEAVNALQSQGLIQLKRFYCDAKHCLKCSIGHQVLK